ncbi:MAG: response regulator transcription factor [Thermodesulfobacteriota bacterium]
MKKRVLLADDEKNFLDLVKEELETEDYEVVAAADGVEAVIKAIDGYDIALLDIMMPNLDGISTTRILKRMNPDKPVVVFSGVAGSNDVARAVEVGAEKCLTKPFSVKQLMTDIEKALRG